MREVTAGGLMVLAAATGFGMLATFGKLAEASGLTRPTFLFFRFVLGSLIVWAVLWIRDEASLLGGRPLRATLVLGVIYALLTLSYFAGLSYMTASLTGIVFYTYPIYVFVLSVAFLDEHLSVPRLVALGLALAGVVLVVGVDRVRVAPVGLALVTAAAIGYAVYTVSGRALAAGTSPRILTAHVLITTTIAIGVRWLIAGGGVPRTSYHWGIILGIGVLGTGIPLLLLYEGLGRVDAIHASILGTAEPVATVFFGITVLGESLSLTTVLGGALILGGVTIVQTSQRQRAWLLAKIGIH